MMNARLAAVLLGLLCSSTAPAQDRATAVPTFHCIGLYWAPREGAADNTCHVRYRPFGTTAWHEALPLWFDERRPDEPLHKGDGTTLPAVHCRQYRGSIVNLTPGTEYEIRLALEKTGQEATLTARTWSERFPIARTITVSDTGTPLVVEESGTPDGYVLYAHAARRETAMLDVQNKHRHCVKVRAHHVIVRGLTLRNAQEHGVEIFAGCHDVVIEDCDISGWGRIADDGWGRNVDSAVYSSATDIRRVVIQRNRIHHPRSDSNNWRERRPRPGKREPFHPEGPQAVYLANSEGNHVLRYNTVLSDDHHQYNDIFGASSNFSLRGFPNRDSDIYGNQLSHCWDDAIESEGANCNVRIWGNYATECFVGVACASTSIGPLYVWRNVTDVMRVAPGDWSGGFLKTSDRMGGGRIFVLHNTILQPTRPLNDGQTTVGARLGLGWGGPMLNVTSRNNILNAKYVAIRDPARDPLGDYDYDLYHGRLPNGDRCEKHGIKDEPTYVESFGFQDGKGRFTLTTQSPGYDEGVRLPNFNDGYTGRGPDMGAHEADTKEMMFGTNAYRLEDK